MTGKDTRDNASYLNRDSQYRIPGELLLEKAFNIAGTIIEFASRIVRAPDNDKT